MTLLRSWDGEVERFEDIQRLAGALVQADLVLIGASNGLDMAEGLNVFRPDTHFAQAYGDLAAATGAQSFLQGLFGSGSDAARLWAWAARYACVEWLDYSPSSIMTTLVGLAAGADRFAITCNLNSRFQVGGIPASNVLETEGSLTQMRCSANCCDVRFSVEAVARGLNASIRGGAADADLIPRCPTCGALMVPAIDEVRLRRPDTQARERLQVLNDLLERHRGGRVVVLELGVGLRNGVIKKILAQACTITSNVTYAVFNYNQSVVPQGLEEQTVVFTGDMTPVFEALGRATN